MNFPASISKIYQLEVKKHQNNITFAGVLSVFAFDAILL